MSNWSPENIGLVITAIAGLVTAISALIHSHNTRKGITDELETSLDKETKSTDKPLCKGNGE